MCGMVGVVHQIPQEKLLEIYNEGNKLKILDIHSTPRPQTQLKQKISNSIKPSARTTRKNFSYQLNHKSTFCNFQKKIKIFKSISVCH